MTLVIFAVPLFVWLSFFFFLAVQRLQFSLLCSFAMDVFSGLVGYYFGKKAFRKLANSSRPPPPFMSVRFLGAPRLLSTTASSIPK